MCLNLLIMLRVEKTQNMNTRTCLQALEHRFYLLLLLVTLLTLFVQIANIRFYHSYYTSLSYLRQTSAPIQLTIILDMLETQGASYILIEELFEKITFNLHLIWIDKS